LHDYFSQKLTFYHLNYWALIYVGSVELHQFIKKRRYKSCCMLKYTTFTHLPNTFQHPQYVPFLVAELTDFLHFSQYLTKYPCVTMSCNFLQLFHLSSWTCMMSQCQMICCKCLVTIQLAILHFLLFCDQFDYFSVHFVLDLHSVLLQVYYYVKKIKSILLFFGHSHVAFVDAWRENMLGPKKKPQKKKAG
jgi:hypothetical protein